MFFNRIFEKSEKRGAKRVLNQNDLTNIQHPSHITAPIYNLPTSPHIDAYNTLFLC